MDNPKINTNRMWEHLNNPPLIRYLLLWTLGWAIVQVLAYFETVLIVSIFAAILAFVLNSPVKFVSRFIPRWVAVVLVFLLALLILGGLMATLGLAIISQAQQLLEQAPQFLEWAIALLETLQSFLQKRITVDFSTFETQLREQPLGIMGMGFSTQQNVLFNLLDVIVIAVICFFMLLDGRRLGNLIVRLFPCGLRDDLTRAIQNNFLGFFGVGCCYQSSSASLPLWCLFCLIFPMHWSWQQSQAPLI
ncbi:AI-2E family transporter [Microcoleus sp. K5-D4]|uniref:AI-2E family transporter n=2 Tax=Microcoleus TaxID=44471 RepID=UPI002FD6BF00